MSARSFWAELAWLGGDRAEPGVLIDVAGDGSVAGIGRAPTAPDSATVLRGLTLPGLANAHSHAFHRLLRGRTHGTTGSFWTWRETMYEIAGQLDPEQYRAVARAVFAEMLTAGFTVVGEFHYLHHDPVGAPYRDPNSMGRAVIEAARDVGIRLTLLDACYLQGGLDDGGRALPLDAAQRRFADADAVAWAERVSELGGGADCRIGAAIHSVRAVPPDEMRLIAEWAAEREVPLHAHVSEQPAENGQAVAAYGRTPVEVLADAGAVGPRFTAVHATHCSPADIGRLGSAGAAVALCPTTEQDLGDGIGASAAMTDAGVALCVGSDSHATVDPFTEVRAVEMHARLTSGERGVHTTQELLTLGTAGGYGALGWPGGGRLAVGAPVDLTVIRLDSVRTVGADPLAAAVFAATAADVHTVVVGGEVVVSDGRHVRVDVERELAAVLS